METITLIAVVGLGLKLAVAIGSALGVSSGMGWFHKKTITFKKKGGDIDDIAKPETEKFNRSDFK